MEQINLDRRKFLKLGLGAAATAAMPSFARTAESKPKVTLDLYVDSIPGDRLSDTIYRQSGNGLWNSIMNKVKYFFSDYLDLDVNFRTREELDSEKLARDHIAIEYKTLDSYLEKDGWELMHSHGGAKKVDEQRTEVIRRSRLGAKDAEAKVAQGYKEQFRDFFRNIPGIGSEHSHTACMFPSVDPKEKSVTQLTNYVATRIIHEIGHCLGLKHTQEYLGDGIFWGDPDKYGKDNFMNYGVKERNLKFSTTIHKDQVRQIYKFLNTK